MKQYILRVQARTGGQYTIWKDKDKARKAAWEAFTELGYESEILTVTGEGIKIQQAQMIDIF